ncbi:hypothetical protein DM02DRAFT_391653 [Periconia macrospinosa]|uniref:Pleckstrin homology domain-containing protein n=1 Tax=Periconia macrospinosa TaxID=97972 RepID=A0A2V1DUI7_9PLEO|nr:hypothetical protein DM02DRAFT_391653 [Periconia macrospinosa]
MTNDYYSDNEAYITNQPLPSPSGTPYHSLSRRTSRYGASHDGNGPLTAPLPPDPEDAKEQEPPAVENVSFLDPRRFTPTLHASLVSEILSLRRELDSKHKFIEDLETSFHGVRNENEALTEQLSASTREARGMKRQLQQLENGTLSALEEIASERDRMKEANEDLKGKLEGVQKKIRNQEDDSTRVHDMWASEKETWAGEKRALERRVHISEARLKLVLDELALQEAAREEAEMESESESIKLESDAGSIRSSPQRRPSTRTARHSRNQSSSSYRSFGRNYRLSHMSTIDSRSNGINLADELAFDEEDEELGELELDSDDFPENEMKARRALESRQSMYQDEKAKRILGLSSEIHQANRDSLPEATDHEEPKPAPEFARSYAFVHPEVTFVFPPSTPKPEPEDDVKPQYVDTGVQPSPPPSPVRPQTPAIVKPAEAVSPVSEVEANQRKKRVSAQTSPLIPSGQANAVPRLMISTSSQTVEDPLSPPATPINETEILPPPPSEVISVSTQTDSIAEPTTKPSPPPLPLRSPTRPAPPVPLSIPSIAIHAPTSEPQSPKEPILPPGTKTIATQTNSSLTYNMCSTGMQTEPIRIDQRPVKLPPHLLPSAIRSTPGTPEFGQERDRTASANRKDSYQPVSHASETRHAAPSARQDLKELLERMKDPKVEDRYPGNNDNGPLVRETENGISRPFRSSSLFAGFHGASSDEEVSNAEMSDEEEAAPQWSTPMLSSRNVKNGRVFNNPPTPVPEEKEPSPARPSEDSLRTASKRTSMERPTKVSKPARSSVARQPSIRRSAMVQNGTATHMRSRSPSIGSINSNNLVATTKPPFPVPTRSSSRRPVQSKSEGSQSPTLRSQNSFAGRRPYGQRPQRQDSLRKVRSAAVMQKQSRRPRSRSPPPASPVIPPSPSLPPIPSELIPGYNFGHRHQPSTNTTYTGSGSIGSAGYQASVVDAIAVAMVGEWMFKYVRKRKAFGGQESPADFSRGAEDSVLNSNGVRHKRWVWISPYERSVLWSHKQPTTGTALLGKSGRKLVVQSVLDVADNTPTPKSAGAQALFNRSILILTPARALKFTTVSRERHYMWLTALSFLAHSSAPIPELAPPQEEDLPQYQHTGATLRRSHVRDSVRLAKSKTNPVAQRYKNQVDMMPEIPSEFRAERPLPAYADPPTIARGPHGHGRKRSSTGPGAPPPNIAAYRSFSHNQVPSLYSTGSSDMYSSAQPPSVPSSVWNPQSAIGSTRPSESSTSTRQHFFDTMGTVRMEAFINDSVGQAVPVPVPAPRPGFAASRMAKRSASNWSASTNDHPRGALVDDFMSESTDPFRGF